MTIPPSIFNWSLKRAVQALPDHFLKARLRIIYTILLFSLMKSLVVLAVSASNGQTTHLARSVVATVLYLVLAKLLLSRPSLMRAITHFMVAAGLLIVYTNIYLYTFDINLLTVQFVFMISLGSFYALGSRWGIIYSIAASLPVVAFLVLKGIPFSNAPDELASPGFEILAILNFISITIVHYLFYKSFQDNLREKEKLNQQLQLAVAEAHRLADSRIKFLSTMSHELRTPLNSVVGITELLAQDRPQPHQKENLDILQSSTQDLLSLINNILDYNKIDAEHLVLEKTAFQPEVLMRQLWAGLNIKAIHKQLQLKLEVDEQLKDIWVASDPTRLSQVIYNLAGNAIKFTETGQVTIQLRCVARTEDRVEILFSVADTGIGIGSEQHEAIFEWFSQAEINTSRRYGGTGLGLAIVKQLLALFNSTIEVESKPGEGAKFSFSIAFDRTGAAAAQPVHSFNGKDLGHLKLLIAEDNEVNRLILKKQLELLGIEPVMVENGEAAFDALMEGDYDAVFMDLHMPVMDGYTATRNLRASPNARAATTYLVAFTASVTDQEHIADSGFDDFLYKPVTMEDLRALLEKIAVISQPLPQNFI